MVGAGRRVWLAVSDDAAARISGKYFYHLLAARTNSGSASSHKQEAYRWLQKGLDARRE
jgi:hypothetical protein